MTRSEQHAGFYWRIPPCRRGATNNELGTQICCTCCSSFGCEPTQALPPGYPACTCATSATSPQYSYQQRRGTNRHSSLLESQNSLILLFAKTSALNIIKVHRYVLLVSHVIKFDQHADLASCAHAASAMPAVSGTACSPFHIATNPDIAHQRAGGSQEVAHKPMHARCRGRLSPVHILTAVPGFK